MNAKLHKSGGDCGEKKNCSQKNYIISQLNLAVKLKNSLLKNKVSKLCEISDEYGEILQKFNVHVLRKVE